MLKSALSPAFKKNNVPVVIASSNLYAPYTAVFIQSLLDHASEENNYDIIILEREISKENKRILNSIVAGHTNVSIRFYDPSPFFESFHYIDEEHPWPLEVFFRIVAPHILNYPGRIITVGVDTLLKTDIARLMNEDLEGYCVGGVSSAPSIYVICSENPTRYLRGNVTARNYFSNRGIHDWKDLKSYKDYVNCELLLFDCDKYVQTIEAKEILDAAQEGDVFTCDEHIFNRFMRGKIKLLNLAWNVMLPLNVRAAERLNAASILYNEIYNDNEAFERAYKNPYMLHWVSNPKPWVCPDVPWGSEWWQTALRTPFVGHIIARMLDAQEKRRQYYKERYGKENVDVWDPTPKGIDRT